MIFIPESSRLSCSTSCESEGLQNSGADSNALRLGVERTGNLKAAALESRTGNLNFKLDRRRDKINPLDRIRLRSVLFPIFGPVQIWT
jgi:hypothetical protein